MPFGIAYDTITTLARWSIHSFYREVRIIGYENVPKEGPIVVCSTHSNMIVDVAILAATFPHKRKLHFWAKNSLFANKFTRPVLVSGGVVPVDRTTKNNQSLFAATFEVLRLGEIVAVYPEGTSHSESRLLELKDGASWAALEYSARLHKQELTSNEDDTTRDKRGIPQPVIILPCGLTYMQKSKYRSTVMITYGSPIRIEPYIEDFENDKRATVKKLTKHIESEIEKLTINACDWETYNAASMTRMLLFYNDKRILLEDFVKVTQSLVNFYTNTNSEIVSLKTSLDQYKTSLDMLHLTNADVTRYEKRSLSVPWAFYMLMYESFKFLVQLPFFLPGLFFHWPIYVLGKVSMKFEKYEESMAQNKILLGLAWLMISYTVLFFMVWTLLFYTPLGLILAAGAVFIFAWYHIALVDSHYDTFKELVASFRLFAALCSEKGSKPREQVEDLVTKRRYCITTLEKICNEYRSKSDDLRLVLELSERECSSEEEKKKSD